MRGKKTGGRVKGTPNKTTQLLKDTILLAAANLGSDMEGKDGLMGYLEYLGKTEPKAFASLLGRVLPLQVTGENGDPLQVIIKGDDANLL